MDPVNAPLVIEYEGRFYAKYIGGNKASVEGVGLSLGKHAVMVAFGRTHYLYLETEAPRKITYGKVKETFYPPKA